MMKRRCSERHPYLSESQFVIAPDLVLDFIVRQVEYLCVEGDSFIGFYIQKNKLVVVSELRCPLVFLVRVDDLQIQVKTA